VSLKIKIHTIYVLHCNVHVTTVMYIEKTCPDEVDEAGIQWPLMLAGYIAVHRCPRGMTGWSVRSLASLGWVSPGAATEGVTPIF